MDALRIVAVAGVGELYLDILGYEDWHRPQATRLYLGTVPYSPLGPTTARDIAEAVARELWEIVQLVDVME